VALNVVLDHFRANVFGGYLPLFLDMVGTAVAAFTLGPWAAVAVGVTSNVINSAFDPQSFGFGLWSWFALVQVTGALLWGYGYRWAKNRIGRLAYLTILVSVASSLVAFTIIEIAFGGQLSHASGNLFLTALQNAGVQTPALLFQVNLVLSLIDKTISTVIALIIADAVSTRLGAPLLHARR